MLLSYNSLSLYCPQVIIVIEREAPQDRIVSNVSCSKNYSPLVASQSVTAVFIHDYYVTRNHSATFCAVHIYLREFV